MQEHQKGDLRFVSVFCKGQITSHLISRVLPLTARRYNLVGVTRRKHRVESWYFSRETVTVQGGYGVVFAIQVQIFVSITRVAVQV